MSCSKARLTRLRFWMSEQGVDAFYVRALSNIAWITAFDNVFDEEPAHALLVTPDRCILHTDSRYEEACRRAAQGSEIQVDGSTKTHAAFVVDQLLERGTKSGDAKPDPKPAAEPDFKPDPEKSISLALESRIALNEYRQLQEEISESLIAIKIVETDKTIISLRAVKDSEEIVRMKKAQQITDAAFSHIVQFIRLGMTEREVQIELEYFMIRKGAQGLAFSSIVAAGANGASPHAIPGGTKLESGQAIVLDFGARAQGYCSDMTRMIFVGEPSACIKQAYQAIRQANEEVEAFLKPGVTGAEAQQLAETVLEQQGFGGRMGHSLGHGVGIDVHEEPVLASRNTSPLEPGNVVTVEPGIYIPGEFGMRLEDFGVIASQGFEVFTQTSHGMVII